MFDSNFIAQGGAGRSFVIFQWTSEDVLTSSQGWDVEIGDVTIIEKQCLLFTYSMYENAYRCEL